MEKRLECSENLIKEVEERTKINKSKIEQMESQVDAVLESERKIQETKAKLDNMETQSKVVDREEEIQKEINEALQRERKRNRVVISNLTESKDSAKKVQGKLEQLFQEFDVPPGGILQVNKW